MENLRAYLKTLDKQQKEAYAILCGTSIGYLKKALIIGQRFDGALARRLAENSNGAVRKELLRPDIWPELLSDAEKLKYVELLRAA